MRRQSHGPSFPGGRCSASRSPVVRPRSPVTNKGKWRSSSSTPPHLHTYTGARRPLPTLIYVSDLHCVIWTSRPVDRIVSIYYCHLCRGQVDCRRAKLAACVAMNMNEWDSCRRRATIHAAFSHKCVPLSHHQQHRRLETDANITSFFFLQQLCQCQKTEQH